MGSGERTGPGGGTVGGAAGEREKRDGPARLAHWARDGKGPVGEGERAGLRFGPERIELVGFRDGVWVGFLFYFFSYSTNSTKTS